VLIYGGDLIYGVFKFIESEALERGRVSHGMMHGVPCELLCYCVCLFAGVIRKMIPSGVERRRVLIKLYTCTLPARET
jgi:hypothetical protein